MEIAILILALWLWPWHHKKAPPPPAPPPNYFCDPDRVDGDWEPIPCDMIDECDNPWDTNGQRCTDVI